MAEVEQVDRISNLPDALLLEILSFLSTKEAVATSILSKRWKFFWTQVPVLNFSMYGSVSVNCFNAFVDRVLICNDTKSLRLCQFKCTCRRIVNALQYYKWIRNIMRRDVVEIDLNLKRGKLPSGIFSNEKLMVLKLTDFYSPLRNSIHLPNLLTLHLTRIKFSEKFSLDDILMRLPRLEELIILNCFILQNMCIRSSSLKRLNLFDLYRMEEDKIDTIVAVPSLEYLCIDDFILDCKFDIMPSLTEARLHIRFRDSFREQVFKFLQQVSNNLMTLELQVDITKVSLGGDEHDQMSLFPHLKHLVVKGRNCRLIKCSKLSWRYLVLWILQRAPNLVSLDYSVKSNVCYCSPVLATYLPKCRIPTLEVVNISLFEWGKADKRVLEYLLKNAVNLKVLTINLKDTVYGKTIAALTRLFNVPRASSVYVKAKTIQFLKLYNVSYCAGVCNLNLYEWTIPLHIRF
ncbi:putative FBD-associated F-box protein At3g50710 [Chenopodium quinoa]|uniref:putative FBD-associated F-box protein At3g50710 n=1 Tax=Chenopodium quinoa TaxID=63459 RepID=UPI000B781CB9|nr:putative FBD-associated F-box protein At3g50710 [Chenopodium quinoa]